MKGYKAGRSSIITLRLLPTSFTNRHRSNILDPDFAKYRTNKAKVLEIVDPVTLSKKKKDCSNFDKTFVYEVGKVVEEKSFDPDINVVCGEGIHYYDTYWSALNWYNEVNGVKDGKHFRYYKSGAVKGIFNYQDGKRHGKQETFYENDQTESVGFYDMGTQEGSYYEWYDNSNKRCLLNYKNGFLDGQQLAWYSNGKILYETNYEYGIKKGKQINYEENGDFKIRRY